MFLLDRRGINVARSPLRTSLGGQLRHGEAGWLEDFDDIRLQRTRVLGLKEARAVLAVVEKIYRGGKRPRSR